MVERGDFVPQEDANWDPAAVWKQLRYRTTEHWLDGDGQPFLPYTHYGVGGNTKFWGSVLYRLRREDFGASQHADGVSPAWPIDYDTLAPYYDAAERLYHVHGQAGDDPDRAAARRRIRIRRFRTRRGWRRSSSELRAHGLHPSPLPLGLIRPGEAGGCLLCNTCNSFPCRIHAKSDADVCCVRPALGQPNVTLWTGARARRVWSPSPSGRRVEAVEVERGGASAVASRPGSSIVSCGAVNSAALLLRSADGTHPQRARQFVRPRRPPLHGAPGDDDAGLPSASG